MPKLLGTHLHLGRCPHCNVDTPNLKHMGQFSPNPSEGQQRFWRVYACTRCAGLVSAAAYGWDQEVLAVFPASQDASEDLPDRARAYLSQALNSLSSPAGAVMLAASSVDAMLKAKGLASGSLYSRIDQAVAANQITPQMAEWAHDVRLDANDQRHADENASLPDQVQAQKCVEFAMAFGQFLFVLPARVERGLKSAKANGV
jgi:Domain of unknown function (DUF4145)